MHVPYINSRSKRLLHFSRFAARAFDVLRGGVHPGYVGRRQCHVADGNVHGQRDDYDPPFHRVLTVELSAVAARFGLGTLSSTRALQRGARALAHTMLNQLITGAFLIEKPKKPLDLWQFRECVIQKTLAVYQIVFVIGLDEVDNALPQVLKIAKCL